MIKYSSYTNFCLLLDKFSKKLKSIFSILDENILFEEECISNGIYYKIKDELHPIFLDLIKNNNIILNNISLEKILDDIIIFMYSLQKNNIILNKKIMLDIINCYYKKTILRYLKGGVYFNCSICDKKFIFIDDELGLDDDFCKLNICYNCE